MSIIADSRPQATLADYLRIARFDHVTKHVFILPGIALAQLLRGMDFSTLASNIHQSAETGKVDSQITEKFVKSACTYIDPTMPTAMLAAAKAMAARARAWMGSRHSATYCALKARASRALPPHSSLVASKRRMSRSMRNRNRRRHGTRTSARSTRSRLPTSSVASAGSSGARGLLGRCLPGLRRDTIRSA